MLSAGPRLEADAEPLWEQQRADGEPQGLDTGRPSRSSGSEAGQLLRLVSHGPGGWTQVLLPGRPAAPHM